jgi:hypothetical protein
MFPTHTQRVKISVTSVLIIFIHEARAWAKEGENMKKPHRMLNVPEILKSHPQETKSELAVLYFLLL